MNAVVEQRNTPPAVLEQSTSLLQVIERAARDTNVDIDKMERLMQMHERIVARDAETAFNQALNAAQSEMGPISADATNPQTRSKYATYGKLDSRVRPIYTKHGFALSFDEDDSPKADHIRVLCHVSHSAGHKRTYHKDMPADGKGAKGGDVMTKTHASGAAQTYGMRYLLKGIFNIAIGEEDNDGNDDEVEYITEKQAADITTMIQDTKADKAGLLRYFKADSVGTILAKDYPRVITALKKKQEQV